VRFEKPIFILVHGFFRKGFFYNLNEAVEKPNFERAVQL